MSRMYRHLSRRISKIEVAIAILALGFVVNQLGHALEQGEPSLPREQAPKPVVQLK